MAICVAINGFGRYWSQLPSRCIFGASGKLEFVGINDICGQKTLAHLLNMSSVHGRFNGYGRR